MSSDGENAKNQASEVDEKPNLDSTDSSQDATKSETEESPVKKEENDVKAKEKSPEPAKVEAKTEINDNEKADNASEGDKEKNDDSKKVKDEKTKVEKNEEKTDDDTEGGDGSEDGEEEEGEDDDKKEVPLLDQPLEQSGTRERKKVQRFNEDFTPELKEQAANKVDIPNGVGTQLGDIPRIDASISRFKTEDLKLLHRILFKSITMGKPIQIKKNIRKFNGFDFKKSSDEFSKKKDIVKKMEIKQLRSVCEMLDLDKKGGKDELVDKICDFLLEPKDSGKPGGGRPKRTAAVRANNRGYSSHDDDDDDDESDGGRRSSRSTRGKGKRVNLKDESSSESDEQFEPSDSDGSSPQPPVRNMRGNRHRAGPARQHPHDSSDMDHTPPSSDDSEEPKNKRRKSSVGVKVQNNKTKKATPKNVKASPKKAATPAKQNKKPEAKRGRKRKEESEEEKSSEHDEGTSSEDEPLVKKSKSPQPPSDEEIKTYVKEILEGANLEEITMKTVCKQVYAHYPDFDLAHKKDFIKTTVKSLIST